MSSHSLIGLVSTFRRRGRKPARRPSFHRSRLEGLEDRSLLSFGLGFAFNLGDTGQEEGAAVATTPTGDVLLTGRYEGTVDFDPGLGTFNLTAGTNMDGFLANYSSAGAFIQAGGLDYGKPGDVARGSDGSVFVTFETLYEASNYLHRVIKVDPSGSLAWYRDVVCSGELHATGAAVASDGSVYTIGYFQGQADFDPGAGVTTLTSAGLRDIFITKLDASGNFVWARRFGSSNDDQGYDISLDSSGNVYATGFFFNTVNFGPGATSLTSAGYEDVFVLKLDSAGNTLWARQLGGGPSEVGLGIAVDAAGSVYTTGYFWGSGDFNPGTGVATLNSAGENDIFVSKLDTSGNFAWAVRLGGPQQDWGNRIAVDSSGNVYTTGWFRGTADFDPGLATAPLTSAGADDVFVSKLNAQNGAYLDAGAMGGSGTDQGLDIAADSTGNVYVTGLFFGTGDFNPGAGVTNLSSKGNSDAFLVKLTNPSVATDIRMQQATADGQGTMSVSYEIAGAAAGPFAIGFYRSANAAFDGGDEPLSSVQISSSADLAVGLHTKTFTIGSGVGQVALPGAGIAETDADYYLLAVADPVNAVTETDADPLNEDNTAVFQGVYHTPGGAVFVHGTPNDDTLTVSPGSFHLSLNGTPLTYTGADVTGLRARGHLGGDSLDFAFGTGFGIPVTATFFFDGGPGSNTATLRGSAGNDTVTLNPGSATLTGTGFEVRALQAAQITIAGEGGTDTAMLIDASGDDTFTATPTYATMVGLGYANRVDAFAYVYGYGTGGTDTAVMTDSSGNDTFNGKPTESVMAGAGFYNRAKGFDYVYAYAGKGKDTAMLYDSAGDDTFNATPAVTILSGTGFCNRTKSFDYVYAFGSKGTDTALLYDSSGDETFAGAATAAVMSGVGFYNRVKSFDYVHAYASAGGVDTALLYDSIGDDTFNATPTTAILAGPGFYNRAKGFDAASAYGTTGQDVAYLYDSKGNDSFVGAPTYSVMQGAGYYNRAKNFTKVYAYGTAGGTDAATLYDSAQDDLLEAASNWGQISSDDGSPELLYKVIGFEQVTAIGSTGVNVKEVEEGVHFLTLAGDWVTFNPAGLQAFLAATDTLVQDATAYLDERAAAGDTSTIDKTMAFMRARTTMAVDLSSDGATILLTSPEGYSRALITDGMDRPEWTELPEGSAALASAAAESVAEAASVQAQGTLSALKNRNVLVVIPYDLSNLVDEQSVANQLKEKFQRAGLNEPTIVGVPAGGDPVTLQTMQSIGNYGVVVFFTHGGLHRSAQAKDVGSRDVQNAMVFGQPADSQHLDELSRNDVPRDAFSISKAGTIGYTSEFFKTLDLNGTLLMTWACHTAEASTDPDDTLKSIVEAKGGTFVGWNGSKSSAFAAETLLAFVEQLANGNSVAAAWTALINDPVLQGRKWVLPFLFSAQSDIHNLELKGNLDLVITNSALSIDDIQVLEEDDGTTNAIFLVTLSHLSAQDVSFQYQTVNGGAAAGSDYVAVGPTTKTILAGSLGTTITVAVKGDYRVEPDETFYVDISQVTHADVARSRGIATIVNDDEAGFVVEPTSGLVTSESGTSASFTVKLSSEPSAPVTIGLSGDDTEGGLSATSLTFDAATWNSPQTVTVTGVDDSEPDGDITYTITLSAASSADPNYSMMNPPDVSVTNRDNDQVGRFDGAYTGGYSGTCTYPGYGTYPVSGGVAYTVGNGAITVTAPQAGSGTVSSSGSASFGAAGGSVGNATFTGTFVVQPDGSVAASGFWTTTIPGGGSGSGTWNASRPPLTSSASSLASSAAPQGAAELLVAGSTATDTTNAGRPRGTNLLDAAFRDPLLWYLV